MSFVKAEVIKCGTAPGDSNAIRLVVDVFEIYRNEFYGLGLDIKGVVITIVRTTDEAETPG
jgi:hypothetical protein